MGQIAAAINRQDQEIRSVFAVVLSFKKALKRHKKIANAPVK
jgi:hypothetical protein